MAIPQKQSLSLGRRIIGIMQDCSYLKKGKAAQGTGVNYDDAIAMLQPLMVKYGVIQKVTQKEMIEVTQENPIKPTNQRIFQGLYVITLINADDFSDTLDYEVFSHGMDASDKAPGKAHTYATKIALLKAFCIETGDNEESRAEIRDKMTTIDNEQIAELYKHCVVVAENGQQAWNQKANRMFRAFKIGCVEELPASKYDDALKLLKGN